MLQHKFGTKKARGARPIFGPLARGRRSHLLVNCFCKAEGQHDKKERKQKKKDEPMEHGDFLSAISAAVAGL